MKQDYVIPDRGGEWVLEIDYAPAEKMTYDHPGYPSQWELESVFFRMKTETEGWLYIKFPVSVRDVMEQTYRDEIDHYFRASEEIHERMMSSLSARVRMQAGEMP